MTELKVIFQNRGPALEGYLHLPEGPPPFPGVVLCHPHPLNGGNMDNNVVTAVAGALGKSGFAVLRFNFRGVGRSEGEFDQGSGEHDDARAALVFLQERDEVDGERIGLAGYSFGGMIALSVAVKDEAVKAVAAISPIIPENLLAGNIKPLYTICGSEDDLIPPGSISKEVQKAETRGEIRIVEGADHFWWGFEELVGEEVSRFFAYFLL